MAKTTVGVIGETGRMGSILTEMIGQDPRFELGIGYSMENSGDATLDRVFQENDLVIDFSHASLVEANLTAALRSPKPLIICTTGWSPEKMADKLSALSEKVPVIVASNTSVGACLQRYVAGKMAEILDEDFDIDVHEKHHRFKVDSPSGTAVSLAEEMINAKLKVYNLNYELYTPGHFAREEHKIGMSVERSGNIAGTHTASFTSLEESISITHVAFDRTLFAKGAIRAAAWLSEQKTPNIYSMYDVLNLG